LTLSTAPRSATNYCKSATRKKPTRDILLAELKQRGFDQTKDAR
jgi:hypothetical protein